MKVKVKDDLGKVKEIKLGFSWTLFFWGLFVPLFRADWKHFFIIFGVTAILGFIGLGAVVPIVMLVLAFVYNKMYAKDLYQDGFRGINEEENEIFVKYLAE